MNIKEMRTACDMTQAEFAKYFKLSKRTVEAWESFRECPEYLRELIEYKLKKEGLFMNEKITYRTTNDLEHNGWNEETDYIIVKPPFDFGDWLDQNGLNSIYDMKSDTYLIVDNGELTGEQYQIISREKTDEDLIG